MLDRSSPIYDALGHSSGFESTLQNKKRVNETVIISKNRRKKKSYPPVKRIGS